MEIKLKLRPMSEMPKEGIDVVVLSNLCDPRVCCLRGSKLDEDWRDEVEPNDIGWLYNDAIKKSIEEAQGAEKAAGKSNEEWSYSPVTKIEFWRAFDQLKGMINKKPFPATQTDIDELSARIDILEKQERSSYEKR